MTYPITDITRRARKEHDCEVCYGRIKPGQRYRYTVFPWEGSVATWKEHLECGRVGSRLHRKWRYFDEGYSHDGVWEDLYEMYYHSRASMDDEDLLVWTRMNFRRLAS